MLRDVWPSLYVWYFLGLCSSPSWLIAFLEMEFIKENNRLVAVTILFSWFVCNAVVTIIFLSVLHNSRTDNFFRGYERVGKTIGFVVLLFGNVGLYYYSNKSIACMLVFLFLSFYFLCILFYIQPYTDFGILDFLLSASVNQALSLYGLHHTYSWLVLIACTVIAGLRYWLEPELQPPREAESDVFQLSHFRRGWRSFLDGVLLDTVLSTTPPITIADTPPIIIADELAHINLHGKLEPILEHSRDSIDENYASDGLLGRNERKKGLPWTEEEHRLFLIGLAKLGKGDWRGISTNFVTTRTPTQVASHAQKYFIQQANLRRKRRRPASSS